MGIEERRRVVAKTGIGELASDEIAKKLPARREQYPYKVRFDLISEVGDLKSR